MAWHAFIAIKCNGKLNENHWEQVKQWAEVDKVWSSMGDWDFWMEANDNIKNTSDLEKLVFKLRKEPWVQSTTTYWWKEV
ncbi:MAG: hypothetical protein A3F10_05090 [Coxiella sp. RIFCSPHIGHO2_12_FULL_42_15]|nr:MAG: hypothetical protein A3F10_05090 [Coxiella sp. RIFCSPHIGHO2_12_FULL_42_15]